MTQTINKEDRETRLKVLADMAWDTQSRPMFDAVIQMARAMGHTDGVKELGERIVITRTLAKGEEPAA